MSMDSKTIVRVLMQQRDRLFAYIWSIVGDAHLAEDVLQEVSLLAMENGGEVADEVRLAAWLRHAARNKALEAVRRRSRQPTPLDEAILEAMEPDWQQYDALEESELVDLLRTCVKQLTANNQRIVTLRYVDGLKSNEIARRLHRNVSAVYQAITRIHRALSECMSRRLTPIESVPTDG